MRLRDLLRSAAVAVAVILFISPVWYMVLMSLKQPRELFTTLFPRQITFANYISLFQKMDLMMYIENSLFVALSTTIISLALATAAAYAFTRYQFSGKRFLLFFILLTRMLPPIAGVVPLFMLMRSWGLTDTRIALIALYTAFQTPFVIWMLRGFFESIPVELEEAALVDGCTRPQALVRVFLPLITPGLVAAGIFAFTLSWNEFVFALIFTGAKAKTAPVAVPELIGEMGILWGEITAAGTVLSLPIFALAAIVQRHLIGGLTFGAVKG